MNRWRIMAMTMPLLLTISLYAANPFLDAKDDKPVSATFRGNEWGDEIGSDEIPLTARVVTTAPGKDALGHDLQNRIYRSKVTRSKTTRNSAGLLCRD